MEITCPTDSHIANPVIDSDKTFIVKGDKLYNKLLSCISQDDILNTINNVPESERIYPSDNINITDTYITIVGTIINNGDINGTYGFILLKNNTEAMPVSENESPIIVFFDKIYIYKNDTIELKVFKCVNGYPEFVDKCKWIFKEKSISQPSTPSKPSQPSTPTSPSVPTTPSQPQKPSYPISINNCSSNTLDTYPSPEIENVKLIINDEEYTNPGVYRVKFGQKIKIEGNIINTGYPGYARIDILVNNVDLSENIDFRYIDTSSSQEFESQLIANKPLTVYIYTVICNGNEEEVYDKVGPFQINPSFSIIGFFKEIVDGFLRLIKL